MTKRVIGVDTETFRIGPGEVVPKLVCVGAAEWTTRDYERLLYGNGDAELPEFLEYLLTDDDILLVFLNAGYDLAVIRRAYPHLAPAIWRALAREDRITDIGVREKLYNISTTGDVAYRTNPDGSNSRIRYDLESLVLLHLGKDISADKADVDDNWRTNYSALDGLKAVQYPEEAYRYACDDPEHTVGVWEVQEIRSDGCLPGTYGTLHGEFFQTAITYPLQLVTARGMATDQAEVDRIEAWVQRRLAPERTRLLTESWILRPVEPSRPYKNATKKVVMALGVSIDRAKALLDPDRPEQLSEKQIEKLVAAGVKFTAEKKSSIDTKVLHTKVIEVCEANKIKVKMTDPSGEHPDGQVSTADDVMAKLADLDPILAEYKERQDVAQIASTEIPRMRAEVVHFRYDVLKETFRSSSSGGQKGKQLYPATSGHNINPRVRRGYVAREGHVLCSVDFDRLELVTHAQQCLNLFGESVLADRINAGIDVHSYLGAQIALHLHDDFREVCASGGIADDPLAVYEGLMSFKASEDKSLQAIYTKYRKMAKPTGLGYPGGLGPKTFIKLAAGKTYRVHVDLETAELLREIWFDTYPEMRRYFEFVNERLVDPDNPPIEREREDGTIWLSNRYAYTSPLGHYRAGCTYTAAANGFGLQSFAADGFKMAFFNVMRAQDDLSARSILYGTRTLNQIHDEIITELPEDRFLTERAMEQTALMVEAMQLVVPDVKVTASPALMRRWDKRAEAVWSKDKKTLQVWEPPADAEDELDEGLEDESEGLAPEVEA